MTCTKISFMLIRLYPSQFGVIFLNKFEKITSKRVELHGSNLIYTIGFIAETHSLIRADYYSIFFPKLKLIYLRENVLTL